MSKIEKMYAQVCEKLREEVGSSQALALIAEHLKNVCRDNVAACMAVLDSTKTLQGAYQAIESEAYKRYQKDRKQKGVCITRKEGYDIADQYYGIASAAAIEPIVEQVTTAPSTGKVVSLFDML